AALGEILRADVVERMRRQVRRAGPFVQQVRADDDVTGDAGVEQRVADAVAVGEVDHAARLRAAGASAREGRPARSTRSTGPTRLTLSASGCRRGSSSCPP